MSIEVLLVEDSPGDARLTQEAFRQHDASVRLHVVADGVEAAAFLRRDGIYASAPRPDLILLDLNLPKMDGREVLTLIKQDESLKMIPTIILTTSKNGTDVAQCYQLQANCYLNKPSEWDEFERLMRSTTDFWLKRITLPSQSAASLVA